MKRLTKTYQLVLLSLLLSTSVFGQISNSFTALYRDYFIHQNIVNPSSSLEGASLQASLHHKSFMGPLSVIKTYLGNVNYQFSPNSGIGLQFSSEQEGKFFNRDRLYFLYRSAVDLNKKAKLKAGVKLGLINYSFGASSGSAGGASSTFDITAGFIYEQKSFRIGLSAHQLPNIKIKPIDFSFDLPRYIELISSLKLPLNNKLNYTPNLRIRTTGDINNSILMHSHVLNHTKQNWLVGVHHLWNLGVSPTLGYSFNTNSKAGMFTVAFSYFIRTSNSIRTNQLTNQYEIGINFKKPMVIRDNFGSYNWN